MEIYKQKNFFVIKVSLLWEWYETFHKILHYKLFSLPPFNTTNKTGRKSTGYRRMNDYTTIPHWDAQQGWNHIWKLSFRIIMMVIFWLNFTEDWSSEYKICSKVLLPCYWVLELEQKLRRSRNGRCKTRSGSFEEEHADEIFHHPSLARRNVCKKLIENFRSLFQ